MRHSDHDAGDKRPARRGALAEPAPGPERPSLRPRWPDPRRRCCHAPTRPAQTPTSRTQPARELNSHTIAVPRQTPATPPGTTPATMPIGPSQTSAGSRSDWRAQTPSKTARSARPAHRPERVAGSARRIWQAPPARPPASAPMAGCSCRPRIRGSARNCIPPPGARPRRTSPSCEAPTIRAAGHERRSIQSRSKPLPARVVLPCG